MKKIVGGVGLMGLWICLTVGNVQAQADRKMVFGGLTLLKGVSRYSSLDGGAGLWGRYQHPLKNGLTLTAKAGLEYYKISYSYWTGGSIGMGYGYGYNGWGYYYGYGYDPGMVIAGKSHAINLPLTVGGRYYIKTLSKGLLHADANVGINLGTRRSLSASLRIEPEVGFLIPFSQGKFLDVGLGLISSGRPGSTILSVSMAYGLARP